jgi:hypothetical protein
MPARKSVLTLLSLVAAFTLTATPVTSSASVGLGEITVTGGTASVAGTATFAPITTPQSVVGDEAVFGAGTVPQDVMNAAGLVLTDAKIVPYTSGSVSGLRFIWEVANMPSEVPPEGIRYNWALLIGNNTYQLQAKRTSMASVNTIEDPKGHAEQLAAQRGFFQLRGNCVTNYFPAPAPAVNGCYHYAFLNGSFDLPNKRITIDWPYETRDAINRIVAPDFKPGVTLTHCGPPYASASCDKSAGMSIAASLQAVVSNQNISRWINSWEPYYVGGRVQLAVGSAIADPAALTYGPAVPLQGNAWSGTVSGLSATNNTVYVRACNGRSCAYASRRVIF